MVVSNTCIQEKRGWGKWKREKGEGKRTGRIGKGGNKGGKVRRGGEKGKEKVKREKKKKKSLQFHIHCLQCQNITI